MTVALSIWLSLAIASTAVPARAEEPKPAVAIEVDVSALPDEDFTAWLKEDLVERQKRVLRDGGLEVVGEGDADATIRVIVSRYGEGDVNYRFTVALFEAKQSAPMVEHALTCDLCKDSDLVTKVGEEVARMSGRFMHEREAGAGAPSDGQVENGGAEPIEGEPPTDRESKRVGAVGYAGIGALVAGVGVTVGGVVLLTKDPTIRIPPDRTPEEEVVTYRRLGAGLTAGGATMMATGIVLLVVDQTVLRKRRVKRGASTVLHPTFSPAGIGVSFTGRF
jgi:hypothetical protein